MLGSGVVGAADLPKSTTCASAAQRFVAHWGRMRIRPGGCSSAPRDGGVSVRTHSTSPEVCVTAQFDGASRAGVEAFTTMIGCAPAALAAKAATAKAAVKILTSQSSTHDVGRKIT